MRAVFSLVCLTLFYSSSVVAVTRYWINGGSGNFNDGTHWSLSSGGNPINGTISWAITDVAVFDNNSGSPTVIFTASEQIGKFRFYGSDTVTLKANSTYSRTLGINAVDTASLLVSDVSTLIISGTASTTDRNMTVELDNATGVTAKIYGVVEVKEENSGYGEFRKKGSYSTIFFRYGSTYIHNTKETGSDIPIATWHAASTCKITGITGTVPGNLDQPFGNLIWNCPGQTDVFNWPTMPALLGNFTIASTGSGGIKLSDAIDITWNISGSYSQTGGNFYPAGTSANNIINLGGGFSMTGGILSCPGTGSCLFRFNTSGVHNYSKTGGTYYQKIHFEVVSGATLDMGGSIIDNGSSGNFTLNSGGCLKTAHVQGISSTGASGCIQLTGSRTFNAGASYIFYKSGSQATGTGLPATLSSVLTIGTIHNATSLTLTNSPVTINGTLVLVSDSAINSVIASGTISYGSNGTLEYQGDTAQVTTDIEFPSTSGPYNLKINNAYGVSLHEDRTINGTIYLSIGQFLIGAHTLTINGTLSQTMGVLKGGLSSNIIVGGTGNLLTLPPVMLNDLTLNRPAGMTGTGLDTVYGRFTLTQGTLWPAGVLVYGPEATLKYNGSSAQTTTSAEFPENYGPCNLENSNPIRLDLHSSRIIQGNLQLNSGIFSIGSNTLTINGLITGPGTLLGGSSSDIVFGGSGPATTLPGITLSDLTIDRASGINMGGTVTITNSLNLLEGDFSIGFNTLILNDELNYDGGNLTGSLSSRLIIAGQGDPVSLDAITLNELNLSRPSILYLEDNILVEGILILSAGNIYRQGHTLYGSDATLIYYGATAQATSGEEWPWNDGPHHIIIQNSQGVYLDSSRKVTGDLTLAKGDLHIGGNTLILEGIINPVMGNLSGGTESALEIEGNGDGTQIPSVDLRKLKINRQTGAWLAGVCTIYDSLHLVAGNLMVNNQTLILQGGPVTGDPNNLITEPVSNLVFAGDHTGVSIPESITDLNYLAVSNPNGVVLQSDILLNSSCEVTGYMICGEHSLSGNAGVNILPGARFATAHPAGISGTIGVALPSFLSSGADYEFNGNYPQETNFLETSTPGLIRNLIVNTAEGIPLVLTGNITTSEGVHVSSGSILTIPDEITLTAGNPE
ncbi:MAG: hypothetical protein KBC43_10805 [Bacteroidales bacterium]|nr:hypothetical protein [Bacteroidales bacterium]